MHGCQSLNDCVGEVKCQPGMDPGRNTCVGLRAFLRPCCWPDAGESGPSYFRILDISAFLSKTIPTKRLPAPCSGVPALLVVVLSIIRVVAVCAAPILRPVGWLCGENQNIVEESDDAVK